VCAHHDRIDLGSTVRDRETIDAGFRLLASLRWLFHEYGAEPLCRQVEESLAELLDELLDERLTANAHRRMV
jgi:hypothetical protein